MIKFGEVSSELQKSSLEDTNAYKEIKPQETLSKDEADNYWDNLFENEIDIPELEDDLLRSVFGRSEDEFNYDFEISDDIVEILQKIKGSEWAYLDDSEKTDIVTSLSNKISEMLGLDECPDISYYDADLNNCGSYNQSTNSVEINRHLLAYPEELVNVVAHELRHAYQHQKAMAPESLIDIQYRINFENYITPICLGDGKYLFFADYQDQLVEVDARAFAKQFSKMEVAV